MDISFTVGGITCGHCVEHITSELEELPQVEKVTITQQPGVGVVVVKTTGDQELSRSEVENALAEAGEYTIITFNN